MMERPWDSWTPTPNVTQDMINATVAKYKAWDRVVSESWLDDEFKRPRAYAMLGDTAVYMYAFFKNLDNPELPFVMYPYQDRICADKSRKIIFAASNQIGKSVTLECKAIHYAQLNPGKTVVMVSLTLKQSTDLMLHIKHLLAASSLDLNWGLGDYETKTEIYFRHFDNDGNELPQSRIICTPATTGALGFAVDLLLLDELAFYDNGEYLFSQVFQPRTYATKGQIITFSNPNGEQGIFWKLWQDSEFSKYNFMFLDKPGNSLTEYESLRRTLTREAFDSTVDGKFTSAAGGFLSVDERRKIQYARPNEIPIALQEAIYIFFDWAKSNDRTVRAAGYGITMPNGFVKVYVHELKEYAHGTTYDVEIDDLVQLARAYPGKILMVGWDNTGVGRGIEDFIKRIQEFGIMVNPVEFSLENKSRIYVLFKFLVEQDRIDLPFVEECDKQLSKLRFERTSRGYLQVHHESESDRDDFPDSIAGLCSLIIQPDSAPITITIVGREDNSSIGGYGDGGFAREFPGTDERRRRLMEEMPDDEFML